MAHTPGPWKNGGYQDMVLYGPDDNDGDSTIIAVLKFKGNAIAIPESSYSCPSLTSQKKNARLIAAAPDLLEACKAALPNYPQLTYAHNGKDEYAPHPVYVILKAAIAKAEDKS